MYSRSAPLVTVARRPLAQLLHDLRALDDLRRRADEVDARLDGLTVAIDAVLEQLPFLRGRYARTLVHRDARFELLLLSWSPGSASPVHDHAGQDCWFIPLCGAFDLDDFALLDDPPPGDEVGGQARLTPLRSRRVETGELDRRDAYEGVHAVTPAAPRCVSLHLYARPLDRCRVFDLRRSRWTWRRLFYDAVASQLGE
jgi:cysteine dioxygenase